MKKIITLNGKVITIGNKIYNFIYPDIYNILLSSGIYNSYSKDNNGFIWSWGYNNYGQLGYGSIINKSTPNQIYLSEKIFCQITSGQYHAYALDDIGQIWSWGNNDYYQLGDNSNINKCTPISIHGYTKTFCEVASGNIHSLAIDYNGQVWSWGYNLYGQLGNNTNLIQRTPVSISGNEKTFCNISGGNSHSMGIDYMGQIWSWGRNNSGQLGIFGPLTNKSTPTSIHGYKKTFCKIKTGFNSSISIEYTGMIWGWGYNNYGQLGNNSISNKCTPVSILGNKKTFCEISLNNYHTLAIDKYGQIWGWGYNNYGQIGDSSLRNRSTPVSILGAKKTFCQINTGYYHSLAVDYKGNIWSWGYNNYGQLGDNTTTMKISPEQIGGYKKTFCEISSGAFNAIAINYNGNVWSWGDNEYSQLGNNSIYNEKTPISLLGNKKTFCQVSSGYYHVMSLDYKGQIWGWGYNNRGQIGDNSITSRATPVSILGNKKTFCNIKSGHYFSISIDKNGQIWSWGFNNYGQLGDNTITSKRTPVSILGSKKTFCNIYCGFAHNVAINNQNNSFSWGYNVYGQLGDNSIISKRTPVSIYNVKTICKISLGFYHTAVIDHNGKIWCWGYNNQGQLGDNSNISRLTPVNIFGENKTFCHISSGDYFTISIDKYGQVWSWGDNNYGQLGIGTTISKITPTMILGYKKTFCKISTGKEHTNAIDYKGQVWGWGRNDYGQIGDNYDRRTPVRVYVL